MAATLESALVIIDRASGPVRGIRREVRGLHGDAERAGKALDDMAGPKAAKDLEKLAEDTRVYRGALRDVRDELPLVNRGMDAYSRRIDATRRNTDKLVTSTDRLAASLQTLGALEARPQVQIDGLAQSRAELAMLRAELRAFGASSATARATVAGRVAAGAGGGAGGAGRTGAYIGTGGVGIVTSRTRALAGAAIVALPIVDSLAGATVALGGSLMGAGLGGGAVTVAGGGVLAAGLGSVIAVAKPAQKALEDATKAREKYDEAVRESGKWSEQALAAQRELSRAYADQPGLRRATREISALNREWKELTAPGRQEWFGLRGDLAQIGRRAAPRMARNANVATRAVRTAGTAQARFLAGDEMQDTAAILTREFARDLPIAEHALENVELVFTRIARASRPFFREGIEWIDHTTDGWEQSTRNVGKLRREIGGYVEDLKDWGDLTGSAFELVKDVLMGGRPAGGSAVEDLTKTLDRWDRWVERNPEKMDRFFRNAVDDTADIAKSVVGIVRGLHDMAVELRPLIGPLTTVASLFGALSSNLSPGAAMTAVLGLRGARGAIAGRRGAGGAGGGAAAAGGMGIVPVGVGGGRAAAAAAGGGAALAAYPTHQQMRANAAAGRAGARTNWTGWTPGGAAGPGRASRMGGSALRGAGAAGRFALPAVAIGGLTGAFGASGSNQGDDPFSTAMWGVRNTAQGALGIFGLANPVLGTDERTNRGLSRAQQFVGQLPGGDAPTAAEATRAARGMRAELGDAEQRAADAVGNRNDFAEAMAYLKALRAQAQAYRDIAKEAKHAATIERNERSREHAGELTESFGKSFDILSPKVGIEGAMDKTVRGVYQKMRGMNRVGAKILGENVLGWAAAQARANPALLDEVNWLNRRIERRFSKMGDRVEVVNGRIVSNSASEWKRIASAMIEPAELARQEVTAAFTDIEQQAASSLRLMGYTPREAKSLVKSGKYGSAAKMQKKLAPAEKLLGAAYGDGIGRGIGDGTGNATMGGRGGTSPALMGAKAGLGGYAAAAAGMGLRVSSGLRPGAVTSSGNPSFHGSGDAIDLAGPPSAMMQFAQYAASKWGSHLEELIYTPFGKGQIKNGSNFVYGGQVAADHHDHVHIADTAPSGGGGGPSAGLSMDTAGPGLQRVSLKGPKSRLRGAPGALSGAASAAYAAGLESKLNAMLGAGGPGLPAGPGGKISGSLSQMIAAAGLPPIFNKIINAESGGDPNARNPSGASGLAQIMMPLHSSLVASAGGNVFDPRTNLAVAKQLFDESGLAPWVASRGTWGRGDGIGWDRPSMGAGGGPARIEVQGGGSHPVTVAPNITIKAGGVGTAQIVAIVDRRLDEFAAQVEADFAELSMESAGSLL